MPRSKTFLPDVNVWLALASRRHVHATICSDWLNSIDGDQVAFCRVTQMGLLRLLTNESVMGSDVLASRDAWRVYRSMLADERLEFAPEPFTLEPEWRKLTSQERPTPRIWTDAYLAAFARSSGMQLVTLDQGAAALSNGSALLLG